MAWDVDRIVSYLQSNVSRVDWNVETERLVLKFGRPFKGIKRPKGIRLGREKQCFANAMNLANEDGLMYVEGYALSRSSWPFDHAWVSFDGVHALELTLRNNPEEITFFGVAFPWDLYIELFLSRPPCPFLSYPINPLVEPGLEQIRRNAPS